VTPLFAAHRKPNKRRAALQWDVRSGSNRFAYISRYKSLSGLAIWATVNPIRFGRILDFVLVGDEMTVIIRRLNGKAPL
jgi:hypothetical protein